MNERYIKWHTPWLSRDFEMLAFGDGGGLPLILFPTSFGSYYQNKDFGLVGSVDQAAARARELISLGVTDFNCVVPPGARGRAIVERLINEVKPKVS